MALVNAYLAFNGDCEAAFNLYRSVFGGEFRAFSRFSEMPADPKNPLPDGWGQKVLHVALPVSQETILMGSDNNPHMGTVTFGQNISMSVGVSSKEEADKIFNGLAVGGKVTMPLADTFWNAYFGMLVDKFGITWMVNYDYPR